MSIWDVISAHVSCVKCGTKGVGNCDCYVEIQCTVCKRVRIVDRFPEAGDLKLIRIVCPDCGKVPT